MDGCSSLKSINVGNTNSTWDTVSTSMTGADRYYSIDGLLYKGSELIRCPEGYTGINDDGIIASEDLGDITCISSYAFRNCDKLLKVTLPDTVAAIPDGLFYGCGLLKEFNVSPKLESIGRSSFSFCDSLKELIIPEGVKSIGRNAFSYSNSLVVYGYADTYVEEYAKKNGGFNFTYINIDNDIDEMKLGMASLSLDGTISMNFYLQLSQGILDDIKNNFLEFEVADQKYIRSINKSDYISEDGVDYYHFSVPLLPKLVDEPVHCRLYRKGDGAESQTGSRTLDYTMREYLERAKDTEKTAALAKAIANYADRAKVYFDYSGDNQGSADNEGFAGSLEDIKPVNALDLVEYAAKLDEMPAGYEYVGSSLVLKDSTTIRHYFRGDPDNCKLYVVDEAANEIEINPCLAGNGLFYIDITNIAALDYDKMFMVKLCTADESATIEYSVFSYAYKVLTGGSSNEKLVELIKAMYWYRVESEGYCKE